LAIQYRPGGIPRGVFLCARAEQLVVALAVLLLLAHVARLAPAAHAQTALAGTIVDLSHPYDADTIYWPTEEGFVLEKEFEGVTEKGYFYSANKFRSAEHGGTHVDAPIHFSAHGQRVDEIPIERLVGPGVVVDVEAACLADRDHQVSVADLEAFEREHGAIPRGAIVLLYTGLGRYWPDRVRYLGTSERGAAAVASLHFPGLSADAARWLVTSREVHAVGIDTASIDHGPSKRFETHQVLSAANVPAFENVASLDLLPPRDFRIVALPMKIGGGSGAPSRILAILP
jgi:kynurenine formamidase